MNKYESFIKSNNIKSLEGVIDLILFENPFKEKKGKLMKEISLITIEYLNSIGEIYYAKNKNAIYFLENKSKKLLNIKEELFEIFLSEITWINASDKNLIYIHKDIIKYWILRAERILINTFSYYDKEWNTLYLSNNNWNITKISSEKIENINNWENWILFEDNDDNKWDFLWNKNILLENNNNEDFLTKCFKNISINEVKKESNIIILKSYFYSLFFHELFENHIIIGFLGPQGSWKSSLLSIISYIINWTFELSNLPFTEKDFKNNLINQKYNFFDNVDSNISPYFKDIIAQSTMKVNIKSRKLFKDTEQITSTINTNIWLTSRNPHIFNRTDVNDRFLVFYFKEIINKNSEYFEVNKYLKNNFSLVMSQICYDLRNIIKKLDNYENISSNFRMIEFLQFSYNINKDKYNKKEMIEIFNDFRSKQKKLYNLQDQLLLLVIESLKNKQIEYYKQYNSEQLHSILSKYSKKIWVKYELNTISLGRKLIKHIDWYKESWVDIFLPRKINNKTIFIFKETKEWKI